MNIAFNRGYAAAALIMFACCGSALANDAGAPEIKRELKVYTQPGTDLAKKRLFVEFIESPKLTALFRKAMIDRGYQLVDSADSSEAQLRFRGFASVGLFATKPATAPLAEIVEKARLEAPGKETAQVDNTTLADVAIRDVVGHSISTSFGQLVTGSSLVDWIGDATGVHGAFNQALTGDPRGFCMNKNCNKYQQKVMVAVTGYATWILSSSVLDEKIILDQLIEETLGKALEPLPQISSNM